MSISRIGAQAPHFGALVATKVNYQPEDKIITTVTRRTASGKQEQKEETQDVPFEATFNLKATQSEDKDFSHISGLTTADPVNTPVKVNLSVTPEGYLKLDSEYTKEWTETYWTEEAHQVPDYYVHAGEEVAPYCRASSSYWEYKTEYENVQKTRDHSEQVKKSLVADSQEKFNELYRFLNTVKDQSTDITALFKDIQTRGKAFVAGAQAAVADAWQVKEAALRHEFETRLAALKAGEAKETGGGDGG